MTHTMSPTETQVRRPTVALATLLTCQLMIVLDITVMNVALPHIQSELNFTPTGLSWVMNGYTLAVAGLLLLGGRLGDLFGRRRLLVSGVALFAVASLVGGVATTATVLIIARAAQGVGSAMAGPSTLALLTTIFADPVSRMRALAWFSGVASAGFAIGLVLGGLLTEWFGWRSVLFINVPIGLAVVVIASKQVPESEGQRARLDLPGALTATAGLVSLVYGFVNAAAHGWSQPRTILCLGAAALLIAAFGSIEWRAAAPLLPLRLFADRDRAAGYLGMLLGPMVGMSMFYFVTQYLQKVHELSPLATGLAFLPLAVPVFACSQLTPRLLSRYGPKRIAMIGAALFAVAMATLTQLSVTTSYFPLIFLAMVMVGFGLGLGFAPLSVVIMATVPPHDAGAAGGALQTMQNIGGALGLAILVTISGSATRDATGTASEVLVTGMTAAFVGSVLIATLSFLTASTFRSR